MFSSISKKLQEPHKIQIVKKRYKNLLRDLCNIYEDNAAMAVEEELKELKGERERERIRNNSTPNSTDMKSMNISTQNTNISTQNTIQSVSDKFIDRQKTSNSPTSLNSNNSISSSKSISCVKYQELSKVIDKLIDLKYVLSRGAAQFFQTNKIGEELIKKIKIVAPVCEELFNPDNSGCLNNIMNVPESYLVGHSLGAVGNVELMNGLKKVGDSVSSKSSKSNDSQFWAGGDFKMVLGDSSSSPK